MSTKVFVSPGLYTSEKDISYVTRQVGVTTLGLVGETTIGPAFQPIFISNYSEFQSFFGGLNATKIKDNGAPKYELPYIAKSYLTQANQLYVTRVLGLSGYDAGLAWGITLDADMDPTTKVETGITNYTGGANSLISYTATSAGTIVSLVGATPLLQELISIGELTNDLKFLGYGDVGTSSSIVGHHIKSGGTFSGVSINLGIATKSTFSGGTMVSGTTSGSTISYSGTPYTDVDNKIIALLRSRGMVDTDTQLPIFEVSNINDVDFDVNTVDYKNDPLGNFKLTGLSTTQGIFDIELSLNKTKKNYITKVLGRTVSDGNTPLFVEEFYGNLLTSLVNDSKVIGLKSTLIDYSDKFNDYKQEYSPAVTPYVLSELRGNKLLKLFRFWTISDGDTANELFKISIVNIKPDTKEFDVIIRSFYDTDARPVILESYSRCTMDPLSNNFIGRRIGTNNGFYPSKSSYVLVELDETSDTSDAFPAGFNGYPIRNYQENNNTSVINPDMIYKKSYTVFENKRKSYLGLSDTYGIDADFFDYKGVPTSSLLDSWTGLTKGFHLDVDATGATIDNVTVVINSSGDTYSPIFEFETGDWEFRTDGGLSGGPYEKLYARKFTFAPYGGFDGWDIYRTRRSNLDTFTINGSKGSSGLTSGTFKNRSLSNGDLGINSDYYAYLEAIWTFNNPEAVNINVFATPGIDVMDNSNLIEETIEMVENDRADSLYIVTTPDTDSGGEVMSVEDIAGYLDGMFDSNYTCTYWPWVQTNDTENNTYIFIPPTAEVVRNIALTDNIAYPWFTVAGLQRGDMNVIQARKKLTESERDVLYDGRINPITTFASDGVKIFGNKNLQVKETALNRINVRRLLLQTRKLISAVAIRLLFEQNDNVVRNQFLSMVNPILENIRNERGLTDFRIELSNDPEDYDRNQLSGKIYIKPTKSLEYISLDFIVMNTGASFDNV